jgi:exopolysaccharide biosynthesis polyprenyl glycosylphosphotransferase
MPSFMPAPASIALPGLQTRFALRGKPDCWRPIAADLALVALNWVVLAALAASGSIRHMVPAAGDAMHLTGPYIGMALLHGALITLWGHKDGLYSAASLEKQLHTLGGSVAGSTMLLGAAFWLEGMLTWSVVGAVGALSFVSLAAWRWTDAKRGRREQRTDSRNVLIVGAGDFGRRIAAHMSGPEAGRIVCGFLDDHRPLGDSVIGRVGNLARVARAGFIDEIVLAIPHDRDRSLWVLQEARRLRLDVTMALDLLSCASPGVQIEEFGGLPVISLHAEPLPDAALRVKRCIDIVGASAAIVLLAPLLAVIAAMVKIDSNGAAVYAALRAGRKGKPFRCYKFRTMVENADSLKPGLQKENQRSGPFFKIADDPRVTRVGRFFRRYSFDELPQLWNVLRGEMSLVGPRPHPLDDYAGYEVEHLARLDMTPGITGLWQVTARRDPSFQRGVELDREYIQGWSLGLDAKILVRTLMAVASGSGN